MQPNCRQCLTNMLRPKLALPVSYEEREVNLIWAVSTSDTVYVRYATAEHDYSDEFTTTQICYRPVTLVAKLIGGRFSLGCLPLFSIAAVLDHIKPWRTHPLDFLNPDNHQPLCLACHQAKTILEEGGFGRKRKAPTQAVKLPPVADLLG